MAYAVKDVQFGTETKWFLILFNFFRMKEKALGRILILIFIIAAGQCENTFGQSTCERSFLLYETFGSEYDFDEYVRHPHVVNYKFADDDKTNNSHGPLGDEGSYAVTYNPFLVHKGFLKKLDHTSDDLRGGMLVVNAKGTSEVFYRRTVVEALPADELQVSFALLAWSGSNIEFRILDAETMEIIDSKSTGRISKSEWTEHNFKFPPILHKKYIFELKNITTGAGGNDFAIDDVRIEQRNVQVPKGYHFTGAQDKNWGNPNNWICNNEPNDSGDEVYIYSDCEITTNDFKGKEWGNIRLSEGNLTIVNDEGNKVFRQQDEAKLIGEGHTLFIRNQKGKFYIDLKQTENLHLVIENSKSNLIFTNTEYGKLRLKSLTLSEDFVKRLNLERLVLELEDGLYWKNGLLKGKGGVDINGVSIPAGEITGKVVFLARRDESGKVKKAHLVSVPSNIKALFGSYKKINKIEFEFQQYIDNKKDEWYSLTSPVIGGNLSEWKNLGGANDGLLDIKSNNLYVWKENGYASHGEWGNGFVAINPASAATGKGQCYSVHLASSKGAKSYRFSHTGKKFSAGDVEIAVTKTASSIQGHISGINRIGNPYWAPVSWDKIYSRSEVRNNFYPTIYIWDGAHGVFHYYQASGSLNDPKDIAIRQGLSSNESVFNGVIPEGRGFFVVMKPTSSASALKLKESDKIFTKKPGSARKSGKVQPNHLLLELTNTKSHDKDRVLLAFREGSSVQKDEWDASKNNTAKYIIFSSILRDEDVAIDTRPVKAGSNKFSYPLRTWVANKGTYEISIPKGYGVPGNMKCMLTDLKSGKTVELVQGEKGYVFDYQYEPSGKRFEINLQLESVNIHGIVKGYTGAPYKDMKLCWKNEAGMKYFSTNENGEFSGQVLKTKGQLDLNFSYPEIPSASYSIFDQLAFIRHAEGQEKLALPLVADMNNDGKLNELDLEEIGRLTVMETTDAPWMTLNSRGENQPYYRLTESSLTGELNFVVAPKGDLDVDKGGEQEQRDELKLHTEFRDEGESWSLELSADRAEWLNGIQGAINIPNGFAVEQVNSTLDNLRINSEQLRSGELLFSWVDAKGNPKEFQRNKAFLSLKLTHDGSGIEEADVDLTSVKIASEASARGNKRLNVLYEKLKINQVLGFESANNKIFNVYPTFVSDQLTIESDIAAYTCSLYNIEGGLVYSKNAGKKELINLSNLSEGIYLLKIQWQGEQLIHRIVKK